jgi:hypothetical protein
MKRYNMGKLRVLANATNHYLDYAGIDLQALRQAISRELRRLTRAARRSFFVITQPSSNKEAIGESAFWMA